MQAIKKRYELIGKKIGLNKEEITKIEELELQENTQSGIQKMFGSLPIICWHTNSDVLEMKWLNIMDGRLYYEMNKNEKPVSLKFHHKLKF